MWLLLIQKIAKRLIDTAAGQKCLKPSTSFYAACAYGYLVHAYIVPDFKYSNILAATLQ
jgi:hypothetical protein